MSLQLIRGEGNPSSPQDQELRFRLPKEGIAVMPLPWGVISHGKRYNVYISQGAFKKTVQGTPPTLAEIGGAEGLAKIIGRAVREDEYPDFLVAEGDRMQALHEAFFQAAHNVPGRRFHDGMKFALPIRNGDTIEVVPLEGLYGPDTEPSAEAGAFYVVMPDEVSPERPTVEEFRAKYQSRE